MWDFSFPQIISSTATTRADKEKTKWHNIDTRQSAVTVKTFELLEITHLQSINIFVLLTFLWAWFTLLFKDLGTVWFNHFESLLCAPMLHLFDKKTCFIVKYYYNLKLNFLFGYMILNVIYLYDGKANFSAAINPVFSVTPNLQKSS